MIIQCYESIFAVTTTMYSGRDRVIHKSVFSPITRDGIPIFEGELIAKGKAILEEEYLHVEYIKTIKTIQRWIN